MHPQGCDSHSQCFRFLTSFLPIALTYLFLFFARYAAQWMCFDACPVTAILPHSAARIKALTPGECHAPQQQIVA